MCRFQLLLSTRMAVAAIFVSGSLTGCFRNDHVLPEQRQTTSRKFKLGKTEVEFDAEAALVKMEPDPRGPSGEMRAFDFQWRERPVRVQEIEASKAGHPALELLVDGRSYGTIAYGDRLVVKKDGIYVNGLKRQPSSTSRSSKVPPTLTNAIRMELVLIPSSEFLMGSPKSEEGRSVGQ